MTKPNRLRLRSRVSPVQLTRCQMTRKLHPLACLLTLVAVGAPAVAQPVPTPPTDVASGGVTPPAGTPPAGVTPPGPASGAVRYVDDEDYSCEVDANCYEGEFCLQGTCRFEPDIPAWQAARQRLLGPSGPAAATQGGEPTGATPTTSGCSEHRDCTNGQWCVSGACVTPPAARCQQDSECRRGFSCSEGRCQEGPPCQLSVDCTGRRVCLARGEFGRLCRKPIFLGASLITTVGVAGDGRNARPGTVTSFVVGKRWMGRFGPATAENAVGFAGDFGIAPTYRVWADGANVALLRGHLALLGLEALVSRPSTDVFVSYYSAADLEVVLNVGRLQLFATPVGLQGRFLTLESLGDVQAAGLNYRIGLGLGGLL